MASAAGTSPSRTCGQKQQESERAAPAVSFTGGKETMRQAVHSYLSRAAAHHVLPQAACAEGLELRRDRLRHSSEGIIPVLQSNVRRSMADDCRLCTPQGGKRRSKASSLRILARRKVTRCSTQRRS